VPDPTLHVTEAEAIRELSRAIVSQSDIISVLRMVSTAALGLVEADRVSIFVLDKERKMLWTPMADGQEMIQVPEGRGIVGEAIRSSAPVTVGDVASDGRFFADIDRQTGYATRNVLCVPMPGRGLHALGAIEVLNKKHGQFTERDQQVLSALGAQAGLAIEYAEMYEDVRQNNSQMQLLLDIQHSINLSMEVEQILGVILSKLVPAVDGVSGVVQTISACGAAAYHGYHAEHGDRFWGENDRRQWPTHLARLRTLLDNCANQRGAVAFLQTQQLVYAELRRAGNLVGFIAVEIKDSRLRLFNPVSLDHVKVIAEQTVSLLAKREAIEERRRSEKQALLGSMLSTVVHDMKNPLSGISGFAQLIKRRVEDTNAREYCDIILETLTRVERMNSELLRFVRGETIELEKREFSLKEFFEGFVKTLSVSCQQSKIEIGLVCEEDIRVCADKDKLFRVFCNIVSNAREAIGAAGGSIRIAITRTDNSARVCIQDSGKGMPSYVQEHLFQPFVTHGKKNGTGLGMAIAKNIVDEHRGTISLKSALGKGTEFTVTLPTN